MPVHTTDALILRTYDFGEADRIVVFLTRDHGKKRGVANGARRPRSRFVGGLEPLTLTRVAYYERERRDLVRLNDVDTLRSPMTACHADGLGYVEYFAELLDECLPEADPNTALFRLGACMVESLGGNTPVTRLARYFEYWVLKLQGVYPSLTCHRCGAFPDGGGRLDPGHMEFLCVACAGDRGVPLSADAVRFLQLAAVTPPAGLADAELAARADGELDRVHRRLLSAHLEKELRAGKVLRAMAGG
ncbi:MAG: DNA repair protein RecO [Acidobacteriota bacterium]|nr:DNA repair protein RecO [Acidobacteriota bacterium]